MVKKHNKPSSQNPKGGISEQEAPIHISNLSLLTSKGEITRVGYKTVEGKKSRVASKSDEII
jgi:large subunit ribosomal protein L24